MKNSQEVYFYNKKKKKSTVKRNTVKRKLLKAPKILKKCKQKNIKELLIFCFEWK